MARNEAGVATAFSVRPWTHEDAHAFWGWVQDDPALWEQWDLPGDPNLIGLVVHTVSLMADPHVRLVAVEQDGALVGAAALTRIQRDGSAFAHLVIAPKHRGIGREVARVLVREAFDRLGVTALVAQVRTDNPRARAFAESVGFGAMPYDFLLMKRDGHGD